MVWLTLGGIRGVVDVSTFESGELFFDMLDLDEIAIGFPDFDFFLAGAPSLAFDEGDFSRRFFELTLVEGDGKIDSAYLSVKRWNNIRSSCLIL